jgi:hypothetical protein
MVARKIPGLVDDEVVGGQMDQAAESLAVRASSSTKAWSPWRASTSWRPAPSCEDPQACSNRMSQSIAWQAGDLQFCGYVAHCHRRV